jgi:hypothetical protein
MYDNFCRRYTNDFAKYTIEQSVVDQLQANWSSIKIRLIEKNVNENPDGTYTTNHNRYYVYTYNIICEGLSNVYVMRTCMYNPN